MTTHFNNNPLYYDAVNRLGDALEKAEQQLATSSPAQCARYPLVLRLGSSRSGSTLFTQWASATGVFAYPTNIMALFQKSPVVGAYIQSLLTDPRFRLNGEFDDLYKQPDPSSTSGKTKGASAPNEFWGFWLRYFTFPPTPITEAEWSAAAQFNAFNNDIKALISLFDRPFLLKGHNLTHYLDSFSRQAHNVVYVHMYRDPVDVIVSVLKARVTRYGDPDYFFGWRPREFEQLLAYDRVRQVAGQVYFNERAIIRATPALGDRRLLISYDQLCAAPARVFADVRDLVVKHSAVTIDSNYSGPSRFNRATAESSDRDAASDALRYWTSKHGPLVYSDGYTWG